jgi:flagellar biosynthesis protein FlhG
VSSLANVSITGPLPQGLKYTGDNRFKPDDQASRLRSMVDAMNGTSHAPAPRPSLQPPQAARPAPAASPERRCPVVSITSGKGGVGKTNTCVNLAIALSQLKLRATLLDADLGLANADVLCGLTPTTRLDAIVQAPRQDPLVYGNNPPRRNLSHIAIDAPGGFRLVPGAVGLSRMANLPVQQRDIILRGLSDLEADSDVVLVDTGAGLSDSVTTFAAAADLTVVIATPEPTSIADAYAMIKCVAHLRAVKAPGTGFRTVLVINQAQTKAEGEAVHARIAATAKRFLGIEPPLLGVLTQDDAVPAAVRARKPVLLGAPNSKVSKDLRALSASLAHLLGVQRQAPQPPTKRGLFGFLRGK